MTTLIKIKHASVAVHGAEACSYLADLISPQWMVDGDAGCGIDMASNTDSPDLELFNSDQGLRMVWHKAGEKPLKFHLDFEKIAVQLRSFPAPKQGAFNQALGKKTKTIIDATGGWGGDSLLMSLQGYQVTLIERLPIMAILLTDAFARLADSPWARDNNVVIPNVLCGNALTLFKQDLLTADCVYLDPMFPPKRKKSAATNKQMQLLQWLAGPDDDASDLAEYVVSNFSRLAVKRPDHAQPLLPRGNAQEPKPSVQFSSKLVHYDVYLKSF